MVFRRGSDRRPGGSPTFLAEKIRFLTILVAVLAACSGGQDVNPASPLPPEPGIAPPQRIVFVSIDTLRADHLGCYGYARPTSPHLDDLCEEGIVFEQAIAAAPSTLPSHASMFTSLIPAHHGALISRRHPLAEAHMTLAEVLRDSGYRTAGFHAGGQVDGAHGLDQGFDTYASRSSFAEVVAAGVSWLDSLEAGDPAFLFLHTYDVHHPYDPPQEHRLFDDPDYSGDLPAKISIELLREFNEGKKLGEGDLERIVATYDAGIHAMDATLGSLFEELKQRAVYDDALIIVTSDHGEEFGEHGWVGWHAHSLYDELLHVPLVVRIPMAKFAGIRVGHQVSGLDIAPTILALAGLEAPESFQGTSLFLAGHPFAISQRDGSRALLKTAARSRDTKVITKRPNWTFPHARVFDLVSDPGERHPSRPWPWQLSRVQSEAVLAAVEARALHPVRAVEFSSDMEEQLKALGYLDDDTHR